MKGLAWSIGPDSGFMSPPVLDPMATVAVAAVLALTGIGAGLVPARRASRVAPAEALRSV